MNTFFLLRSATLTVTAIATYARRWPLWNRGCAPIDVYKRQVFIPLDDQEAAFVNAFTKPGQRVVEFSNGVMEGDEIVILNGPLMNQTGLIKKLDRHKRLAYLEMEILGRKKTVKIGLEIVRKRP